MADELYHFKYTRKYRKNGKWVYIYGDRSLHKEYKSALREYNNATQSYNRAARLLTKYQDSKYRQDNLKSAQAAVTAAYQKVSALDIRNDRDQ